MTLETKRKTISLAKDTEILFDNLEEIRPKNISFSSMVAITVKDYLRTHTHMNMPDTKVAPPVYAEGVHWRDYIRELNSEDLVFLQRKLSDIQRLIQGEQT